MRAPWDADHEVTPALARELIADRFPALAPRRVQPLGSGWDNSAFLVDGARVFRFPRRESAAAFLRAETRALPALAPRLPLPVPEPLWVAEGDGRFPLPFSGYRRLPGRTACSVEPRGRAAREVAGALGTFLAALHSSPAEDLGLPGDVLRRTDFASRAPLLEERLLSLREAGVVGDPEPWLRRFAEGGDPEPPVQPAVVHGDLYARHVLLRRDGRVGGIIDWGDLHLGDPAVDLSVAWLLLPPEARGTLLGAYGPVDGGTWETARRRALFHAASTAWYARSAGDAALLRTGLRGLRHVLEV